MENEILIQVKVDAGESAERLAIIRARLNEVKENNKALLKEQKFLNDTLRNTGTLTGEQAQRLKDLSAATATNSAELKELTAQEKMYSAQVQIATQNDRKYGDSIVELGAQLTQLKQEYRGLTAAQREGAEGKAMLESIQRLDTAMKDANAALGDHQANVGNYVSALTGLNGKVLQVANLFQGGFVKGLKAAASSVKAFGKTLLTTPIGWISAAVGLLVKAFQKLKEGFDKNDAASTKLKSAMAALRPIADGITKIFVKLADVVATAAEKMANFVKWAAEKLGFDSYVQAADAAQRLVETNDKLEEQARQLQRAEADRAKQISADEAIIRDKANKTAEERMAAAKRIDEANRQSYQEKLDLAQKEYDALVALANQTNDTSDEMEQQITNAYVKMTQAVTDFNNATAKNNRQTSKLEAELEQERKARHEAYKRRMEERKRLQQEAIDGLDTELKKLRDLQTELMDEGLDKITITINAQYDDQIEGVQKQLDSVKERLANEKNLTQEAKAALLEQEKTFNDQIVALNQLRYKALSEAQQAELDAANKKIEQMDADAQQRIIETRKKFQEEYAAWIETLDLETQQKIQEQYGDPFVAAQAELDAAQMKYDSLVNMDAEAKAKMFDTDAQYTKAVLDAQKALYDAQEKNIQQQLDFAETMASTLSNIGNSFGDMFEAVAGDSEEFEKYRKAMAVVDAGIAMAVAIAKAVESASSVPFPGNLVAIAAAVATVTAQIAAVIKTLKSTSVPSAGSFAYGGIVGGNSYHGDKLTANVNSGEMIIPREKQQRLYDMIVDGVPTNNFDYELLASITVSAVAALPNPVLDYSEFTRFQRRVQAVERKTSL